MLFKCRSVVNKICSLLNNISSQNLPVTHLNNSSKGITALFYNRNFCTSTNKNENTSAINYDLVTNGDEELTRKLKILELELEVLRQEGCTIPSLTSISVERWKDILNLPSRSARIKFYRFLFLNEMKKENEKKKKLKKAKEWAEKEKEEKSDLPVEEFAQKHGLGHNTILLRIYDTTVNQFYNNRLIQAIRFGEKLVVDCGYGEHMNPRETMNCAKQLMLLFAENRFHDDPFDLHFCNVDKKGQLMKHFSNLIPTAYEPWFPLNFHQESYLSIFPKDQLVYLTPHCREEMTTFDPNLVYIVGAMVDKADNDPVSLAKAKKEGLKMAKLPLDKYLSWGLGGKSLTLNQMVSILLDIKHTRNWQHALRHVPKRKLVIEDTSTATYHNIERATNTLRFDRPEKNKTKWIPKNSEFDTKRGKKFDKMKARLVNLSNVINE